MPQATQKERCTITDRQKVKHACAVLKELDERYFHVAQTNPQVSSVLNNTNDLKKLLEKKHETDSRVLEEPSEQGYLLADKLWILIRRRKANFREISMRQWSFDMDKILRIEKRTPEQVADVIDWCQQDDFWQDNILSPFKLRKQLDKLELKMERDRKWQRNHKLRKPVDGKSAKQKYLESLNAAD